jgi:hypothetical protein
MCRLVGVGVTQVNGTKWSNIRTQLESRIGFDLFDPHTKVEKTHENDVGDSLSPGRVGSQRGSDLVQR